MGSSQISCGSLISISTWLLEKHRWHQHGITIERWKNVWQHTLWQGGFAKVPILVSGVVCNLHFPIILDFFAHDCLWIRSQLSRILSLPNSTDLVLPSEAHSLLWHSNLSVYTIFHLFSHVLFSFFWSMGPGVRYKHFSSKWQNEVLCV